MNAEIKFAKVKENGIIPSKTSENAGLDIYACFEKDYMFFQPHETKLIPTGIASACSEDYYLQLFERGGTGSKGIILHAGVIDSGYRNEWFVSLANGNDCPLVIAKEGVTEYQVFGMTKPSKFVWYPYEKAICQAIVLPVPKLTIEEIQYSELMEIKSERGLGCLGSSGK